MTDLNDVIKVLIAEGIGEGPEGMRRIGEVILNRAAISGKTPEQIVRESNQFTGYQHPGSATRRAMSDPKSIEKATAAWNLALQPGDPTNGANFYHTPAVNPSWDNNMTNKGQYGNHIFYADRPIPPGEIPSVASLTDTVPPAAVAPVTPSIDLAQMRRQAAPSNFLPDTFASLPGSGSTANLGDQIAMDPIRGGKQMVPQMDAGFDPSMDAMRLYRTPSASDMARGQTPSSIPALPRPRPQTAPADLISTDMQRIASANPTRLPALPPSTLPNALAPMPVVQSVDLRQSRLPLPNASPIGQSPATRVVTSIPMPDSQGARSRFENVPMGRSRAAIPQSFAGMEGSYRPPVAQPSGTTIDNKPQDRLAATPALPPALYGGVAASAVPPAPYPTIARAPLPIPNAPAVATQLAVTPPRVAPVPFNRPNFGMGGVDINEPPTANGVAAPTPMPRLQRGGIFGKPQIMGHDVPLPGIFGMVQGATRTMNNASGPFNNGADNALYNLFRGGDFNTPGAATARGGGFLFAPNPNGGFTNVGRDPNFSPRDGSPGNGGLNTVFDRAFGEARNHN